MLNWIRIPCPPRAQNDYPGRGLAMDKYDVLKLDNQLCFPLYAASREIIRRYNPLLSEYGLTYTQYITMMVMWEEKCTTVKDLGSRLFLDSGTLTPVLKELEHKGYVTRERSVEDERVLVVKITDPGAALRDKVLGVPGKVASCVNLEPQEAAELYRLLNKVIGREPATRTLNS